MLQVAAPAEPSVFEELLAEFGDGFAQVLAALTSSKVRLPTTIYYFHPYMTGVNCGCLQRCIQMGVTHDTPCGHGDHVPLSWSSYL